MNIIIGNWGNETIALLSWCLKNQLQNVYLLTVDTGWQSAIWKQRIEEGLHFATQNAIQVITLKPTLSFPEIIKHRGAFPTPSFLWCADTLKKTPILKWLTENDSRSEATILLPYVKATSQHQYLAYDEETAREHYDDREVIAPLLHTSKEECHELVTAAHFQWLTTKSQECAPCVKSSLKELKLNDKDEIAKLAALEKAVGKTLCHNAQGKPIDIETYLASAESITDVAAGIELSCSDYFGCGS
jgi:hypothetical protein